MSVQAPTRPFAVRVIRRLGHRLQSNLSGLAVSVFGLAIAVGLGAFAITHMPSGGAQGDRADQFMEALRDHNTDEMMQSTTQRFRERIALQTALSSSSLGRRTTGQPATIVSFREVGSVSLKQGGSVHFFIASSKDANGNEAEVPYTVTVAQDGLVDNVD
jgi:hypothetical protein